MPASPPKNTALEGIRVLDLTHQVAGPSATLVLALLGADVVKVVPPGDESSFDGIPFYLNNLNKRSIRLDLKSDEGRAKLLELAAVSDVFVENFGPGVIERLGLDYETVKAVKPDIIYGQIKGFAADSAYAEFPCFDPIAQAFSGASSVTGLPEQLPIKPGPDVGDTGTGMMLANSLLAALLQRARTGEGQHIYISMTDQVATFLRIHFGWPIGQGKDTPRFGNAAPFPIPVAPSGLYATKPFGPNDYVHIHAGNAKQLQKFFEAIGRPDLASDPRFADYRELAPHVDFINQVTNEWAAERDKIEAMEILGAAGVPAGAVRTTTEVANDPDLHRRGIFTRIPHPTLGEIPVPSWPASMSATRIDVRPPTRPGSDTDEVLAEWLS